MWEKANNWTQRHEKLAAFLLTIVLFAPLGLIDIFTGYMVQSNFPVYAVIFGMGQLALTLIIIRLMQNLKVFSISNFMFKDMGKGFLLAWVGILFAIVVFLMSLFQLPENSMIAPAPFPLFASVFATLTTGVFEETLVRGLVLGLLLRMMNTTKKRILSACLFSSIFFGLAHLFNIWSVGAVLPVVVQVVNATAMGLFFSALFLRTGTLWIPILVHALINLASMIFNAITSPDVLQQMNQTQYEPNIIGSIIGAAVIVLPFLTTGLILLRKVNPDSIAYRFPDANEQ